MKNNYFRHTIRQNIYDEVWISVSYNHDQWMCKKVLLSQPKSPLFRWYCYLWPPFLWFLCFKSRLWSSSSGVCCVVWLWGMTECSKEYETSQKTLAHEHGTEPSCIEFQWHQVTLFDFVILEWECLFLSFILILTCINCMSSYFLNMFCGDCCWHIRCWRRTRDHCRHGGSDNDQGDKRWNGRLDQCSMHSVSISNRKNFFIASWPSSPAPSLACFVLSLGYVYIPQNLVHNSQIEGYTFISMEPRLFQQFSHTFRQVYI